MFMMRIAQDIKSWRSTLYELTWCNDSNEKFDMHNVPGMRDAETVPENAPFLSHIEGLLNEPKFMQIPTHTLNDYFKPTAVRPSWTRRDMPPTIADTMREWHLTKSQVEFAVMVVHNFHKAKDGKDPDQMLALCLSTSGMGKS